MDCVFCRIIRGELPAYMLHQDERTVSFLDINPVNRGHCLVVPREHFEYFHQLPQHLMEPLLKSVSFISSVLVKAVGAEGFNLFLNNGPVAGQIIPHVHFHILPRHPGDGIRFRALHRKLPDSEMKNIQKAVIEQISSLE